MVEYLSSMRTRLAVVGSSFVLLGALGLTGCAASPGVAASLVAASPTPTATAPTTAEARAHVEAVALVKTAILPAGARPVKSVSGSELALPFTSIGCKPLVVVTRYAIVSDSTVPAVLAQLRSGPGANRITGYGTSTQNGRVLNAGVIEGSYSDRKLTVRLAPLDGGNVGVRVDAQVVPDSASCVSAGGPVRSGTAKP